MKINLFVFVIRKPEECHLEDVGVYRGKTFKRNFRNIKTESGCLKVPEDKMNFVGLVNIVMTRDLMDYCLHKNNIEKVCSTKMCS